MESKHAKEAGRHKKTLFIILLCFAVAVAAFLAAYFIFSDTANENHTNGGVSVKIDPSAQEVEASDAPKQESEGVAVPGWSTLTISAGEKQVSLNFMNPKANEGKYYLSFELRLKETGEVLCTTGLVPPGQAIQTVTLTKPLEKGEYAAIIHVQPYRMDEEQTPTNNADMETTLIVK